MFWSSAFLSSNIKHGNSSGLPLFFPSWWIKHWSNPLIQQRRGHNISLYSRVVFPRCFLMCVLLFFLFCSPVPLQKNTLWKKNAEKVGLNLSRFDCKSHGYRWSTLAGDWCHPFALCVPWRLLFRFPVIGFHSFGCFWWFFPKRKSPFPQQIGPWRFLVGEVQTMPETIVKRWHPQRKGWSLNPQAFWKEYVYPADFSFLWFDGGNLSKTWAVSLEMSICFSWTVGCETPVLGCVVLAFWFGIWYVVSLKNPSQYGIRFGVDFTLNYPDVSANSPPHESNQVIHFCYSS